MGLMYAMRLCRFLWKRGVWENGGTRFLVKKYHFIDVAVSDGSLLLVAITKLTEEGCFSVWMMKEYGVPGSWTNLSIFHIWKGYEAESLVLLDEANEFAEEEASEDDDSNGVSKEHSFSPDGVDKDLQKNSKGNKNATVHYTERSK
ncbi:hypothetical protein GH714_002194 [Hevea brasiliensis]|uniref:F-box associated domain-containing protein n=1 Tax=Hevea brasiliensis TaxID=3981 RepID=A0A6A6KWT4_HEVBR|nr:hypothetical protein GH714_002194 [Hevea brasiliensis]